jgi:hypothetical protein
MFEPAEAGHPFQHRGHPLFSGWAASIKASKRGSLVKGERISLPAQNLRRPAGLLRIEIRRHCRWAKNELAIRGLRICKQVLVWAPALEVTMDNPLTRLASADENASASHPLPQGGEGKRVNAPLAPLGERGWG